MRVKRTGELPSSLDDRRFFLPLSNPSSTPRRLNPLPSRLYDFLSRENGLFFDMAILSKQNVIQFLQLPAWVKDTRTLKFEMFYMQGAIPFDTD